VRDVTAMPQVSQYVTDVTARVRLQDLSVQARGAGTPGDLR
jgi:hypothetical protein